MVKRIGGEQKLQEVNSELGLLIICSLTNTDSNGKSIMIRESLSSQGKGRVDDTS